MVKSSIHSCLYTEGGEVCPLPPSVRMARVRSGPPFHSPATVGSRTRPMKRMLPVGL